MTGGAALMRNSIIVLFLFTALLLAAAFTGDKELPPLSGRKIFPGLSRGDVIFPHEQHHEWGVSCFHCHHRSRKGGDVVAYEELVSGSPAVSCIDCHGKGRELERMHHRMCIGCHEDLITKSVKTGPVTCGRCHIKKGR
ncbi:MAG TPA: cytochrome c3 family protein [Spirochaetota bacterium]|nr:cytochrome c3 family protein [Spirochaetota bacterium]